MSYWNDSMYYLIWQKFSLNFSVFIVTTETFWNPDAPTYMPKETVA